MLRISTIDTSTECRLVLEGKMVEPWVAEFTRNSNKVLESIAGRRLVIDLENVTVISREAESALLEVMKRGAKFCCNGVLTRHVLKQLEHQCPCRVSARSRSIRARGQRAK